MGLADMMISWLFTSLFEMLGAVYVPSTAWEISSTLLTNFQISKDGM
jgi:hypothetical protein